ncbi:MAG: hypothetical protein WA642_06900, partial [Steroidobacteraceae bacterium]
ARLHERERTITELNLQLRELTLLLRKEQATRDSLAKRIRELEQQLSARRRPKPKASGGPRRPKRKGSTRHGAELRRPPVRQGLKESAARKRRR